ncbi:MAG: type II toxin-antitoxin system RelE/ParE family toxin [Plesiomonas sp.]|uniref:type II toxin-antitoxin system RelE/ParE family toxin n=1 Tax=Plesiomonas sp. TaxID=2486279 RepID=UPI003F3FFB24
MKPTENLSEFELFLTTASHKLTQNIYKKLNAYTELNDVYYCNSLKILNPKIWGYKGTIYKLRVDCGKESARVLFIKTPEHDIVLLNAFIKKTQKTPKKEAAIAIKNLTIFNNTPELKALTNIKL